MPASEMLMAPPIYANGGAAAPSGVSSPLDSMFDSSGWNVAFGGSEIDSTASRATAAPLAEYLPWAVLAVVAVLGLKWIRK